MEGKNAIDNVLLRMQVNDNGKNTDAENIEKIIDEWLKDKHIHAKTRLTRNQITSLSILKSIADTYNIACLKKFLKNFQRYKLSEDGKSSEELVEILKERTQPEQEDNLLGHLGRYLEK